MKAKRIAAGVGKTTLALLAGAFMPALIWVAIVVAIKTRMIPGHHEAKTAEAKLG